MNGNPRREKGSLLLVSLHNAGPNCHSNSAHRRTGQPMTGRSGEVMPRLGSPLVPIFCPRWDPGRGWSRLGSTRSACSKPGSLRALACGLARAHELFLDPLHCSGSDRTFLLSVSNYLGPSVTLPVCLLALVTPDDCPPVSALRLLVFSKQGLTEGSLTCSQEVTHHLRLQTGLASLRGTFFHGKLLSCKQTQVWKPS